MAKSNTAAKTTKTATKPSTSKKASTSKKLPTNSSSDKKNDQNAPENQGLTGQLQGKDIHIDINQSGASLGTHESGAPLDGNSSKPDENSPDEKAKSVEPSQATITSESNSPKQKLTVVFPYLANAAIGDELKYAVRAWERNFQEDFDIVIIGDRPDFIADNVQHIPALEVMGNPQLDMAAKLMQAIASHLVSDDFILTNDDIYLVNPITLDELRVPRINGDLGEEKYRAGSSYSQRLFHTLELLRAFRLPTKDYATHLPVVYNKQKLAETITKFNADTHGLLISNLYFNSFNDAEPVLTKGGPTGDHVVYVYRSNPNVDIIKHGFDHRKFVNHNNDGYLPTLPFLEQAFPEKSKFEK